MFDASSIIVGLDLGTSKICAIVAEVNEQGAIHIVGLGQSKSRGVRKGEIVDANACNEDIRNAIVEAEHMADVEIRSVFLGVTGSHIRGFNNRGFHPVVSADREITEDDVHDVLKNAKAINLPAENRVVHVIRQHFRVDGQDGIVNPIGMAGARVEVDVHVVHGHYSRLQNPIRVVKALQLEVDDIVFSGLASALALLNPQQKELGALVIDLGSGATEYVVYSEGIIKFTGVLAVGGDHVSNDLAYGLKIPLGRAEQLKIDHGAALCSPEDKGKTIGGANELGLPERSVNLEHLRRIMSLRFEEIFQLIAEEVEEAGLLDRLRAGVVLTGGGARAPRVAKLANQVFAAPVQIGVCQSLSSIQSSLDQPEFSAAIGLAKYGSYEWKKRGKNRFSFRQGFRETFSQLFGRGDS